MPPKKKKQPPSGTESFYLECTTDNHNKFYLMWIECEPNNAWYVNINYGPIDKPGAFSKHSYGSEADAKNFVNRQLTSKFAKGYKIKERKNKTLPTPENIQEPRTKNPNFARFTKMAQDW